MRISQTVSRYNSVFYENEINFDQIKGELRKCNLFCSYIDIL